MSLETAHRIYELIDTGDTAGLAALFTEDSVYHRPGYPPLVGRGRIEHFYNHERVIRDGHHTLDRVLVTEDGLAVHGGFRGTLRDGSQAAHRFAEFFELTADGLISRRDTFFFVPLV
ncbi:nuclear transport factor 2 family protein [Kitasatospora sp. NPDC101157]|uniref:nuclear transport factor 2 family protein n=1 Tax=Kitasatospora sp. NPDC101157 TaxID=3364098 RepID=UPI003801A9ED